MQYAWPKIPTQLTHQKSTFVSLRIDERFYIGNLKPLSLAVDKKCEIATTVMQVKHMGYKAISEI